MAKPEIKRAELDSEDAIELIEKLNAELTERYPEEGATHFRLDAAEVVPGRGVFLVVYLDGEPVGCAALRRLDSADAELKRMYVDGCVRGRGYGRMLLTAIEAEANALGVSRIVLETGVRHPEALGLYESAGFGRIEAFGEYVGSLLSVCMAKEL